MYNIIKVKNYTNNNFYYILNKTIGHTKLFAIVCKIVILLLVSY